MDPTFIAIQSVSKYMHVYSVSEKSGNIQIKRKKNHKTL